MLKLLNINTIPVRGREPSGRFCIEDFWLYAGACGGRKTIVRFRSAHRASLLTACPAEVLPGVLFVRGVQREFEDLLAVLIFSPVRWV